MTRHAAQALGADNSLGRVQIGKRAALAVRGIGHPVERSYAIGANPCCGVLLGGDVIFGQEAFAS